jgi:hypothetical protein
VDHATEGPTAVKKQELQTHIVIPDTQVKPGVPLDHLKWIGQYIVDNWAGKPNVKIIHLGDHADMPSLSSYDVGKKEMEGRRYKADIEAANYGWKILNGPIVEYNRIRKQYKERRWLPERHILLGNHEDRINRAISLDSKLDGTISTDDLDYERMGWTVHSFRHIVWLDGVGYSHYFVNLMNGRPIGGMIESRLKTIGHSFTHGHQQTLLYGIRYVAGKQQNGLVAGACYLHDEDYLGPQQAYWRGIIVKHQVESGSYDPMMVSLDFLCRRYEGKRLSEYKPKVFAPSTE